MATSSINTKYQVLPLFSPKVICSKLASVICGHYAYQLEVLNIKWDLVVVETHDGFQVRQTSVQFAMERTDGKLSENDLQRVHAACEEPGCRSHWSRINQPEVNAFSRQEAENEIWILFFPHTAGQESYGRRNLLLKVAYYCKLYINRIAPN